ncbi:MAG: AAA family ATPase [Desulfobacterales bacterium]|nr:AAA family ATPase [Desulfobacterales bacterium]
MYERYFKFKERPFRLVPDPAYLYLSRSHQEAMAHLVYTVEAGDGFVALTGEVGTGKTTLCRAFLAQLKAGTEVAYILNPPTDPVDLMRAVNRDFGLPADSGDLQDLIHCLNSFLIEKKRQGKNVLLIIDEAQNLNRHVLEQIRLLSNLETTRNKLLQIILVGQPELNNTLQSNQLRQLRQRITLQCQLEPLSLSETGAYIRHRLAVASKNGHRLFSNGAIRRIFRFSDGIPRLINMACDRGLLAAFSEGRKIVSAGIARKAIREFKKTADPTFNRWKFWSAALAAGAVLFMAAMLLYGPFVIQRTDADIPEKDLALKEAEKSVEDSVSTVDPSPPSPAVSDPSALSEAPAPDEPFSLDSWLAAADAVQTRSQAVVEVLRRWEEGDLTLRLADYLKDDLTFFQLTASQAGMEVYPVKDGLDKIEMLGLPAILEFVSPETVNHAYLALNSVEEGLYTLFVPGQTEVFIIDKAALYRFWSGNAYIPWKNFFAISGQIPGNAPGESVVTLKLLLRDLGYEDVDLSPQYDEATRQAVAAVQANQHLSVDGVVGPMTKIALYNMKEGLGIPRLSR